MYARKSTCLPSHGTHLIRAALNTEQLIRLYNSVLENPSNKLVFSRPSSDVVNGIASQVNISFTQATSPHLKLVYSDLFNIANRAKRILSARHQLAALVPLHPVSLSYCRVNVVLQPGDIAVYKNIEGDVAVFAPKGAMVVRYYHTTDQPFYVPADIVVSIARWLGPTDFFRLCRASETLQAQLLRNESSLRQLWKMNVSERVPLVLPDMALMSHVERCEAMESKYLYAVGSPYESGGIRRCFGLGYEKLVKEHIYPDADTLELHAKYGYIESLRKALTPEVVVNIKNHSGGPPPRFRNPNLIPPAVRSGNVELLAYLEGIFGATYKPELLQLAARSGSTEMFLYIEGKLGLNSDDITAYASISNVHGLNQDGLFISAIKGRNLSIIKRVSLATCISVNSDVFAAAVRTGNMAIIEYLEQVAQKQLKECAYDVSINAAIKSRDLVVLKYVVSKISDLRRLVYDSSRDNELKRCKYGIPDIRSGLRLCMRGLYNPVLYAIRYGTIDALDYLVAALGKPFKSCIPSSGDRAIMNAIESGSIEMFKYTWDRSPALKDCDACLMMAVSGGRLEMVRMVVSVFKYSVESISTSMYNALKDDKYHIGHYLWERGANPICVYNLAVAQRNSYMLWILYNIGQYLQGRYTADDDIRTELAWNPPPGWV